MFRFLLSLPHAGSTTVDGLHLFQSPGYSAKATGQFATIKVLSFAGLYATQRVPAGAIADRCVRRALLGLGLRLQRAVLDSFLAVGGEGLGKGRRGSGWVRLGLLGSREL